jgi:Nif-specific regulatory protein
MDQGLAQVQQERDGYRRERDLYRRLLELGNEKDVERFLREALALVTGVVSAHRGYLELYDQNDRKSVPRWWTAHGLSSDGVEEVRSRISRGIIAEVVATGQIISTSSALLDPRFRDRESVETGQIEAVLCAPLGADVPRGVVYLEGRSAPGPFSAEDRDRLEIFARHVAPLAGRVLRDHEASEPDPLAPFRAVLRLDGLVGRSDAFVGVVRQLALLAPLDVTVLLTGESGTGKSHVARVLHDSGPRARGPFVEINCGALPDTLVESELFGAVAGAHSQAKRQMDGKVAAAQGGTLFLDEISELPLTSQGKLLQLLQSKQYYPLGSARAVQADVRLITATNTDLERAVEERRFRDDLFYRLHVMPIRMPTLAERREDIPPMAIAICDEIVKRNRLPLIALSEGALDAVRMADWPGNVRQLAHAIEAGTIRAVGEGAGTVQTTHLFPGGAAAPSGSTFQEATRNFQAKLLLRTLKETDWNVLDASRRLDLGRSHIYHLIRVFGLAKEQ